MDPMEKIYQEHSRTVYAFLLSRTHKDFPVPGVIDITENRCLIYPVVVVLVRHQQNRRIRPDLHKNICFTGILRWEGILMCR